MSDDRQLLRRFATERSESAFSELVARHLPLVYSAALRQTNGDSHLAQDVAQLVFTDLARKASALSESVVLAGWLHRGTLFAARQILRGERRRRVREEQVVTMNAIESQAQNDDWRQIRPLLDEALERLNQSDRDALLLRFFEQQSLAQIGASQGGTEDAARKRIARALEKLRVFLERRGVTTTAAALSAAISANAVQAVPVGMAATLASASLTAAGTGTTFALLNIMTATPLKLAISALAVAGATTALVIQHQAQARLLAENQSLHQQLTQLQGDNSDLSNRLADAGDAKKLSDDEFNELLRLRGEMGRLRNQAGEVGKLRNDNQQLQTELASASAQKQSIPLSPQDQYQLHQMHTMDAIKQIGLAMRLYQGDHDMQNPTNFDQLGTYLGPITNGFSFTYVTGVPDPIGLDDFELMNVGLANDNSPDKLILRERTPYQNPGGGWAMVYCFADGHAEVQFKVNGDFSAFEQQHSVAPPTNGQ